MSGVRSVKIVDGWKHEYVTQNGKVIRDKVTDASTGAFQYVLEFGYDESGRPLTLRWYYNEAETWYNAYYYICNAQGDVVKLVSDSGATIAAYSYDAWGTLLSIQGESNGDAFIAYANPLRYRGYYYDTETGFYYLQSRYYDPIVKRFLNADSYASTGQGFLGYNMFAYCENNPIINSDPEGEFLITAILIGVGVGAAIGGTIGGVSAYKSAKASGAEGSSLFWKTVKGIGKGALIGGAGGGLITATGGVVSLHGASSVIGTAMITSTAAVTARATEVSTLQTRISTNNGKSGWQVVSDCIDSLFSNTGKIVFPLATKTVTTKEAYEFSLSKGPQTFKSFLTSSGGKIIPYAFAAYAWGNAIRSAICDDPVEYAQQKGYSMR